MNHVTEPPKISSVFPNPPPLYHSFTPANIAAIAALRRAHHQDATTTTTTTTTTAARSGPLSAAVDPATPLRIPDVPAQLLNLQPPAEPADGQWRVFGDQYTLDDKLPSLEDQNIERLVPQGGGEIGRDGKHLDRAFELKKLAKSQLLNFLELVGILSHAPENAEAKLNDINTIFINMHHILNEYRPHQARESAIVMLQERLDRTRAETANIRSKTEMARQALEGLNSIELPKPFESQFSWTDDRAAHCECAHKSTEKATWAALDDA